MRKIKFGVTIALLFVTLLFVDGCKGDVPENRIRIFRHQIPGGLSHPSPGLVHDANIVREMMVNPAFSLESENDFPDDKALVNIYFEVVVPEYNSKAKQNWIYVNQELVQNPSYYDEIDLVLCKSRISVDLMKKFRAKNNLKFKILYTKFTSQYNGEFKAEDRDPNIFLHSAGQSFLKNTYTVLDTWIANQNFPKLVVTCRDYCADLIINQRPKITAANIEVHKKLSAENFLEYQTKAGFCFCPSEIEGYGHYINECRASGAVIITTDAGPMNELIEDGVSGLLVKPDYKRQFNIFTDAESSKFYTKTLADAVTRALKLSNAEREGMAKKAREAYDKDRQFLKERLTLLADSVAKHGNFDGVAHLLE